MIKLVDIIVVFLFVFEGFLELFVIDGVCFVVVEVGVKYQGCKDVILIEFVSGFLVVGVFIKLVIWLVNVLDCQVKVGLDSDVGVVFIINFGNLNVFMGCVGEGFVVVICEVVVGVIGLLKDCVFILFIGVIGECLFYDCIMVKIDELVVGLVFDVIENVV